MSRIDIIKNYIGTEDVNDFLAVRKDDFEQHHILNRKSNIKKGKLLKYLKNDLRLLHADARSNLYIFCKRKEETSDKTLNSIKCLDKPYIFFKIEEDELFIYGTPKLFFTIFKKYQKNELKDTKINIFEKQEKHVKEGFSQVLFIQKLLELKKDHDISVYEILFNGLDIFSKRIRCQFSSELKKDDVLELLSKEEFKDYFLKDLNLNLINSISFREGKKNQETLKIRKIDFGKVQLSWKRTKFSDFRKKLSEIFDIYENKTVIFTTNGTLDDLFREVELTNYKVNKIYKKTLEDFKDYIKIDKKRKPVIKLGFLVKSIKELLKDDFIIEEVNYVKSNKLIFPALRSKKKNKKLLRIKDRDSRKIVTYMYLDETALYENKEKFLRDFFIFMPCLIIDFRRKENENYYISCSDFIGALKSKNKEYFLQIISNGKKYLIEDVESDSFRDLFEVVKSELIENFSTYNEKLIPQRKGEFYEKLVFILFSILFKVERLGGPNKQDGNIFVDNDMFIGYDTKNLEDLRIESFLNKKTKKFKDKGYIEKNNIIHYFFIFKKIEKPFFDSLVNNIKSDLAHEVHIKAMDIEFIKNLFDEISVKGVLNFIRDDKQNLITKLLEEKDVILS